MRTVQQTVFLILNRVPATFVTDPELIRPSIPVMTHSLDQKVMFWPERRRQESARLRFLLEISKRERLAISFSVIPPARSNPQMYTKMCVASPHIFCWNGDYHVVSNHRSLQLPMIRLRKGSSNCFRLILSRDRVASKKC